MIYLNAAYLRQIGDSATFFGADYDFMSLFLILTTAFILGFTFLIMFLIINQKSFVKAKV